MCLSVAETTQNIPQKTGNLAVHRPEPFVSSVTVFIALTHLRFRMFSANNITPGHFRRRDRRLCRTLTLCCRSTFGFVFGFPRNTSSFGFIFSVSSSTFALCWELVC